MKRTIVRLQMRVCARSGFQVKCSGVFSPPAHRLSSVVEPRSQCDVCVKRFTALRPAQFHSHYLSPPLRFSQPRTHFRSCSRIAGRSQRSASAENERFLGRSKAMSRPPSRSEQESSTTRERRPRLRRAACVSTAVCVCVKRQK